MDQELRKFGKGKKRTLKQGGKAVIYQRVSSKEQEFGFSPQTQLDICYNWAESHGYEIVRCFAGSYESAKTDDARKRFSEMIEFVKNKKNKIDGVIVYSNSRFSRTGTSSFAILDELEKRGITVFAASSENDPRTPDGKMVQSIELVLANHDNALKSKAVVDAGEKALRSGHRITKAPRGYDMVTNKKEQSITVNKEGVLIRKAFKMKAEENISNEEIRQRMKVMGLDLSKQNWSRIFCNLFYAGYFAHPYLQGDIVKGPHEPLVSLDNFYKVNNIVSKAHSRGYETKNNKEYAPLLGSLKCPVCGHNLTSALSTKMRKKYGRDVGYYVCSHKNCKCNVSTKKANADFESWLDSVSLPDGFTEMLEAQLRKALPIINKDAADEVAEIKENLSHKEKQIEQIEFNLATASNSKVQEICLKKLAQLEKEREVIKAEVEEKDKEILNLNDYITFGLGLKDNMLKLWQLSNLSQKKHLQNLVFPDGLI